MGRSTDEYLSTVEELLGQLQAEIERARQGAVELRTSVRVVEEGATSAEPIEVQEP